MQELISIIVPVYNIQRYISKCIKSIIKQTYMNLEIILIDDGSTDKSGKICDEWKEKDGRIKVIHKENQGVGNTRNVGIKESKGKYLMFIDGDDYIELTMVEDLYRNILENNADIGICGFYYETYNKKVEKNAKESYVVNSEEILKKLFLRENVSFGLWNKMYKKELFDTIKFSNKKVFEDAEVIYELINKAQKISYINKAEYHYVQRIQSVIHRELNNECLNIINVEEEIVNKVRKKYPNIQEEAEIFLIEQLNNYIIISYKGKNKNTYRILINKLKKNINRNVKNSKMRLDIKIKSILIAYLGFSIFYKK